MKTNTAKICTIERAIIDPHLWSEREQIQFYKRMERLHNAHRHAGN